MVIVIVLATGGSGKAARTPGLVGQGLPEAVSTATAKGFKVQLRPASDTQGLGRVSAQQPAAGSGVGNHTLLLTVSTGPGQALVPDVSHLSVRAAEDKLRTAGFTIAPQQNVTSDLTVGVVTATGPTAYTLLRAGMPVTLMVSSGPARTRVPKLVGLTEAATLKQAPKIGLTLIVTHTPGGGTPDRVVSQTPKAGTMAPGRSNLRVTVATALPAPPKVHATMPDVTGKAEEDAVSALSKLKLAIVFTSQAVTRVAKANTVLGQVPAAGAKPLEGSTVTLTIGRLTVASPKTTTKKKG